MNKLRHRRGLNVDLGLSGKVALVLCGEGGLGSAIAAALATEGAKIAVADVSEGAAPAQSRPGATAIRPNTPTPSPFSPVRGPHT
jgi:NAD(P)-dependent dehydrogenase (short-subunit alcohol dehydrogenase family)